MINVGGFLVTPSECPNFGKNYIFRWYFMIDTIKIYTEIDKITYTSIYNKSIIKTSYNKLDGEVYYEIVNDHLLGSYDSRLSVRIGCGSKYQFTNLGYYIEIEGSYHKIIKGYNSHNGFCDLEFISKSLINMVQ